MAKKILFAFSIVTLFSGCTLGPDYQRPPLDLPTAWPAQDSIQLTNETNDAQWWQLYEDPALNQLVDDALSHNRDLRIAAERVNEARAQARIADTYLLPVVSANATADRTKSSLDGSFPPPPGVSRTSSNYRATLDVSYELDLFGRYRRESESALALYLATASAQDALRLSLIAQVCEQYFRLLALDANHDVFMRTLESRNETVRLFKKRLDAGVIPSYVYHQANAEAAAVRAQLTSVAQARLQQESALSVLIGRSPRAILNDTLARGTPTSPPTLVVPGGIPSDLLLRRPDLQQAEQELIAANADIGAVRAQIFPRIALTGFIGGESTSLSDLFSGPAGIYQFAASIAQPIFTGGRNIYGVRAAKARQQQSVLRFENAVASAFRDVRDTLATYSATLEIAKAEHERVDALKMAHREITQRYEGGVANRLEVLDTERQLLQAELSSLDAEQNQRIAVAGVFKALGGGWTASAAGP